MHTFAYEILYFDEFLFCDWRNERPGKSGFWGLFQNFHRLLQTSIHSRSIVLVELFLFLSGHLVEQIIGGDSHTFQQVALCILGKRERHVEVEVARYISYPSAIAGFVVGSEHRLRSVTVSAYRLHVVALTFQDEGCHLRHTRTVVVEQDGGRNVSAQTLRRYRNLLRNPRSIAVWIVVLFLAHVA